MESKLTIEQLKNYLGTGLKYELQFDSHEEFVDLDHCNEFDMAFSKGALWEFVGWSNIELPIGEGEFDGELLQFEKGVYKGNYNDSIPLMYRLSDLDKFIPDLGFVPIDRLPYSKKLSFYKPINLQFDLEITIQTEDYSQEIDLYDGFTIMQKLFQWHFWPFGDEYFETGLVIDKLKHGS